MQYASSTMRLLVCLFFLVQSLAVFLQNKSALKLWYNKSANAIRENALPIGNGRLGAMICGNVAKETIQHTEAIQCRPRNPDSSRGRFDRLTCSTRTHPFRSTATSDARWASPICSCKAPMELFNIHKSQPEATSAERNASVRHSHTARQRVQAGGSMAQHLLKRLFLAHYAYD